MKRIVSLSLLLLAGLILSACGATTAAVPTATTPIRIGTNAWSGYGAIYIAASKGLFTQSGLTVELVNYPTYDQAAADFAAKRLDANLAVMSDAIAEAAAGIPVQMIWETDNSNGG